MKKHMTMTILGTVIAGELQVERLDLPPRRTNHLPGYTQWLDQGAPTDDELDAQASYRAAEIQAAQDELELQEREEMRQEANYQNNEYRQGRW